MSYLAIGAVTKSITELLDKKLNKPALMQGTFRVTTLPPDDDRVSEDTGVNLFLYRLVESPFAKNMPWKGDRTHPNGSARPPLALNLHYLLTGYAKKVALSAQDDIAAHQVLGNAMSILHDFPVLNNVHDADFDADVDTQFAPELRDSFDQVKVSLLPITLDEFSKIFTGLSNAYRLSVAYEVTLVQIAPLFPTPLPRPLAQTPLVRSTTIGPPVIAAVEPSAGPVSAPVTLRGARFSGAGQTTTVTAGGVTIEQNDIVGLTATTLSFTVPPVVAGGPRIEITVKQGGLESTPATYEVRPFLRSMRPLRGTAGIPVEIPFELAAGLTAAAEVNGVSVPAVVDAPNKLVRVLIPGTTPANGPKPVALVLSGAGSPARSNALTYEVMPSIQSFTAIAGGPPATTVVTVSGKRLGGAEVFIRYGKLLARIDTTLAANTDTSVSFTFDRPLPTAGPVSVLVDGRESNALPRSLSAVEPAAAAIGDLVMLSGSGLSGENVVVNFGGTAVNLGPQPFAAQFTIGVPPGLVAGPTTIGMTIDGANTNTVSFAVLA